jgi:hypothetical protein
LIKIEQNIKESNDDYPGQRIAIDLTSCNKVSFGGKKYAHVKIDHGSGMMFVSFLKKKSDAVEDFLEFLKRIINKDEKKVKYIRCDNSGENKLIAKVTRKKYSEIVFEFTAKNTPQQNGKLERNIAYVWSKTRALMTASGITGDLKGKLWCEAFKTSIDIINISTSMKGDQLRNEIWNSTIPRYAFNLRIFGEIGIVKKSGILSKLEEKGFEGMFVGYASDHSGEVYRMLNLQSHKISETRDIKWMKMTYDEYMNKSNDE